MIKRIIIISSIVIIFGLFVWLKFFHPQPILPIKTITVSGNLLNSDASQLKQQLSPFEHEGFFDFSVQDIQSDVQQIPWVASADIKRVWPNKIAIYVHRQQPVAIWNDSQFINAYGEEFVDSLTQDQINQLPKFYGTEDSIVTILDYYQRMNKLLSPLQLYITEIHLTPSQIWTVQLNNGIKLQLGDEDVLTRLNRFVKVYPKIFATKADKISVVDLEYPHGLAVEENSHKKH